MKTKNIIICLHIKPCFILLTGMLALAPVSGILLEYFDWKNALVLISGIMLQGVVCGALLRPVEFSRKPKFTAGNTLQRF